MGERGLLQQTISSSRMIAENASQAMALSTLRRSRSSGRLTGSEMQAYRHNMTIVYAESEYVKHCLALLGTLDQAEDQQPSRPGSRPGSRPQDTSYGPAPEYSEPSDDGGNEPDDGKTFDQQRPLLEYPAYRRPGSTFVEGFGQGYDDGEEAYVSQPEVESDQPAELQEARDRTNRHPRTPKPSKSPRPTSFGRTYHDKPEGSHHHSRRQSTKGKHSGRKRDGQEPYIEPTYDKDSHPRATRRHSKSWTGRDTYAQPVPQVPHPPPAPILHPGHYVPAQLEYVPPGSPIYPTSSPHSHHAQWDPRWSFYQ